MKYDHDNISPLDNRYANKISQFRSNFSESALIKIRFEIEIEWLLFLCTKLSKSFKPLSNESIKKINSFKSNFDDKYVLQIKKIESTTNHDVKAVEYFIADHFNKDKVLSKYVHLIHFGLTSEDINSLSYACLIKNGISLFVNESLNTNKTLLKYTKNWSNISFLARTHGQAASPSTLGKEFKVFSARLSREIQILKAIKPLAKFSGATGNFHTFDIVNSSIDWPKANKGFLKQFGIEQNLYTTQIEPHDWIAETSHSIVRINNILTDLSQDCWMYISNDIFKLKLNKNEVGSSTMPHKVNPIDFENAEGNFGISSALFEFFANKLTKSRHQRDLSDSTVLRNIGLGFGYSSLALSSTNKGLSKITPNISSIKNELDDNWEVLTEAVQTLMRYEGIPDAYEQLKKLSRGSKLTQDSYIGFIENLDISNVSKTKLLALTPSTYIGIAPTLSK
ncbi:adenylosuccinate lyase [Gammaproteobacteria bacterium]|nr:adenylosuccinate lyase [Gammaproteobacteria bacterium]